MPAHAESGTFCSVWPLVQATNSVNISVKFLCNTEHTRVIGTTRIHTKSHINSHVQCVSDACQTRLALNFMPVCTVHLDTGLGG